MSGSQSRKARKVAMPSAPTSSAPEVIGRATWDFIPDRSDWAASASASGGRPSGSRGRMSLRPSRIWRAYQGRIDARSTGGIGGTPGLTAV